MRKKYLLIKKFLKLNIENLIGNQYYIRFDYHDSDIHVANKLGLTLKKYKTILRQYGGIY